MTEKRIAATILIPTLITSLIWGSIAGFFTFILMFSVVFWKNSIISYSAGLILLGPPLLVSVVFGYWIGIFSFLFWLWYLCRKKGIALKISNWHDSLSEKYKG